MSEYNQLCWKCKKACNRELCEWVKFCSINTCRKELSREELLNNLPKGTELDKNNYIISCPNFERDNFKYSGQDIAKSENITYLEYRAKKGNLTNIFCQLLEISERELNNIYDYEMLNKISEKTIEKQSNNFKEIVNLHLKGITITTIERKLDIHRNSIINTITKYYNLLKDKLSEIFSKEINVNVEDITMLTYKFKTVTPLKSYSETIAQNPNKANLQQIKNDYRLTSKQRTQLKRIESLEERLKVYEKYLLENQEKENAKIQKKLDKQSKEEIRQNHRLTKEEKETLYNISDLNERANLYEDYILFYTIPIFSLRYEEKSQINYTYEKLKNQCEEIKTSWLRETILNKLTEIKEERIKNQLEYEERMRQLEQEQQERKLKRSKRKCH